MSVHGDDWPADPWELLRAWLPSNDDPVRPTMTLATVAADGSPDARTVLLSELDDAGFYFHTDSRSRKLEQIAAHPRVALVIPLPEHKRQLTVQGTTEDVDPSELAWAYAHRSDYLRRLAWLNTPELAALPLAERIDRWAGFEPDEPPDTWTGRLVRPTRLTFWAGRDDTASRRIEYVRRDGTWVAHVLPG
ncbi:pyridoxine/pyridoxamine 5'-phosphate oxidase [Aeromicrobium ginsengisoli]|uniref:pyridoxine/pyridoxamine 5'-phosphate oxidase n=1 Tax=Aeromicrobium ginsengisoli TaxID=363867 RepID=UPI00165FA93A|nr:pyridoxamine 5'-phosphate oxidase family protein [Aeromicrobium ginsengisoli]